MPMPDGVKVPLEITVETGYRYERQAARWATIAIGDVVVYSELVYDMDADGNRTDEQARANVLSLFARRLGEVINGMED